VCVCVCVIKYHKYSMLLQVLKLMYIFDASSLGCQNGRADTR